MVDVMRRTPLRRGKPLSRSKRLRSNKPSSERDRWETIKAVVLERDNYRCQFPADSLEHHDKGLDVHHRSLKGHGGTSDEDREYGLAGLVVLCRHHHNMIHHHRQLAERLGFIVPRFPGDDPESVPVLTAGFGWVYLLAGGSRVAAAEPGGPA